MSGIDTSCRTAQRGTAVHLTRAGDAFHASMGNAKRRLRDAIAAKLDDFFELAEYDWTPNTRESAPSMYLYELVNWLTTVLDELAVKEADKDEAYRGAVEYLAMCLMVRLLSGLSDELADVEFRTS